MAGDRGPVERLSAVAKELRARGQADLAQEVDAIRELLPASRSDDDGALMTTGEAAAALGVRSIHTVKQWVQRGLLEGHRRGGRVLVSRRSVEEMRESSAFGGTEEYERALVEALAEVRASNQD